MTTSIFSHVYYKNSISCSVLCDPWSVVEHSLYCRLSTEQSPSQCCGLSVVVGIAMSRTRLCSVRFVTPMSQSRILTSHDEGIKFHMKKLS